MFPIDAGRNDILQVRFKERDPASKIFFVVGTSLPEAEGRKVSDRENASTFIDVRISFPNSIFLVVYHGENKPTTSTFSFDYWYLDQDTNEARQDPIDGYEIEIKEIKGKYMLKRSICRLKLSLIPRGIKKR